MIRYQADDRRRDDFLRRDDCLRRDDFRGDFRRDRHLGGCRHLRRAGGPGLANYHNSVEHLGGVRRSD